MRFNMTRRFGVRASVHRTNLLYYDADSNDRIANRNLHFRNAITEGSVVAEFTRSGTRSATRRTASRATLRRAFPIQSHARGGHRRHLVRVAASGNGRPRNHLHQRGQSLRDDGFAIPFGFGFKWNLGRFSALNLEWGMRRTWTDHIDDVAGYYASLAVLEEEAPCPNSSESRIEREGDIEDPVGQMRGYNGIDDRFAVMSVSLTFRIDKSPTTCWDR